MVGGRRIYIHEHSLRHLCICCEEAAASVHRALLRTAVGKMLNRHIVDDGEGASLVSPAAARQITALINRECGGEITHCFRNLGFRPNLPRERANTYALLDVDEEVTASCYHDGYYTFATGSLAAETMFADNEPIANLRDQTQAGAFDARGDLTILKGRCLITFSALEQLGPGTAINFNRFFARTRRDAIPIYDSEVADAIRFATSILQQIRSGQLCSDHAFLAEKQTLIEQLLPQATRSLA